MQKGRKLQTVYYAVNAVFEEAFAEVDDKAEFYIH